MSATSTPVDITKKVDEIITKIKQMKDKQKLDMQKCLNDKATLTAQVTKLTEELGKVTNELTAKEKELEAAKLEKGTTTQQTQKLDAEIATLKTQKDNLEIELEKAREGLEKINSELTTTVAVAVGGGKKNVFQPFIKGTTEFTKRIQKLYKNKTNKTNKTNKKNKTKRFYGKIMKKRMNKLKK
jgi:chromosome segregation ATPase